MGEANAQVPPGWYPDPARLHAHRYWDGAQWTAHAADPWGQSVDPVAAPDCCKAVATTANLGFRGSRFVGKCEVRVVGVEVQLTGRRVSPAMHTARLAASVLVFPALVAAAFGFIAYGTQVIGLLVMIASALVFLGGVGVLIFTDIWSPRHGMAETVKWRAGFVAKHKRVFDSTSGVGFVLPTMWIREVEGKCVSRVSVPFGPDGRMQRLFLRAAPGSHDWLDFLLLTLPQGGL